MVDGANHKRAVLCADTDRTVITLHDSGGRKLISILAEGKDQPTIDIQRHDEIQRSGDDVNAMDSVRLYSSAKRAREPALSSRTVLLKL